ncbi:MAG: DUF1707 domain-containing protein [Candidatus Dormibacteraeota bacterium]|nr:DUF1707 domain-containing protein [Candidatus Dormibacteraeota bacterium]
MSEVPARAILASDQERDDTVGRLREAVAQGRLTLEDFSQRTDSVLAARTRDQLSAVLADLPAPHSFRALGSRTGYHWLIGVMSSTTRRGPWRVGHEVNALAIMGEAKVDLREASIDAPVVTVNALAIMGNVEVMVPEGVEVELDGIAIMGSREARLGGPPPAPGAPIVRVHGIALMGAVTVRNRPTLVERALRHIRGLGPNRLLK